jgi:hypothetical protein
MAISGGIKLFDRSKCLASDDAEAVASSGDASAPRALDRNPVTYWRTSGSSDAVTETYELTFPADTTFDRILLVDHNFKSFNIKYDVAGVWTHFASVTGISGSLSNITESTFDQDTAYYEFTQVTAPKILISVTTTQVTNAEKYLAQVIVTSELGTLQGFPIIKSTELNRNLRVEKMLSGRVLTMKSDEAFSVNIDFKDYPPSLSADIDLMMGLHDREQNFLVWLCGGKFGSTRFKKQLRGYRLRDVIPVQLTSAMKLSYSSNVYMNPINFSVELEEDVQ